MPSRCLVPLTSLLLAVGCVAADDVVEPTATVASSLSVTHWSLDQKTSNNLSGRSAALAAFDNTMFLVHAANSPSDNDLWFSTFDGTTWTNDSQIKDQLSHSTPRIAAFNGNLYMFHNGDSDDSVWMSRFNPTTGSWNPDSKIGGYVSISSPAVAAFAGSLYIVGVWPGSGQLWLATMSNAEVFTPMQLLPGLFTDSSGFSGEESQMAPGIAVHNNRLFLAYRGSGGEVFVTSTDAKNVFTEPGPAIHWSEVQPALASFQGLLHLIDGSGIIDDPVMWSYSPDGYTWSVPVSLPDQKMADAAALAPWLNQLVLVHPCSAACRLSLTADNNLYFSIFQ